jgi:hypothetical protein
MELLTNFGERSLSFNFQWTQNGRGRVLVANNEGILNLEMLFCDAYTHLQR